MAAALETRTTEQVMALFETLHTHVDPAQQLEVIERLRAALFQDKRLAQLDYARLTRQVQLSAWLDVLDRSDTPDLRGPTMGFLTYLLDRYRQYAPEAMATLLQEEGVLDRLIAFLFHPDPFFQTGAVSLIASCFVNEAIREQLVRSGADLALLDAFATRKGGEFPRLIKMMLDQLGVEASHPPSHSKALFLNTELPDSIRYSAACIWMRYVLHEEVTQEEALEAEPALDFVVSHEHGFKKISPDLVPLFIDYYCPAWVPFIGLDHPSLFRALNIIANFLYHATQYPGEGGGPGRRLNHELSKQVLPLVWRVFDTLDTPENAQLAQNTLLILSRCPSCFFCGPPVAHQDSHQHREEGLVETRKQTQVRVAALASYLKNSDPDLRGSAVAVLLAYAESARKNMETAFALELAFKDTPYHNKPRQLRLYLDRIWNETCGAGAALVEEASDVRAEPILSPEEKAAKEKQHLRHLKSTIKQIEKNVQALCRLHIKLLASPYLSEAACNQRGLLQEDERFGQLFHAWESAADPKAFVAGQPDFSERLALHLQEWQALEKEHDRNENIARKRKLEEECAHTEAALHAEKMRAAATAEAEKQKQQALEEEKFTTRVGNMQASCKRFSDLVRTLQTQQSNTEVERFLKRRIVQECDTMAGLRREEAVKQVKEFLKTDPEWFSHFRDKMQNSGVELQRLTARVEEERAQSETAPLETVHEEVLPATALLQPLASPESVPSARTLSPASASLAVASSAFSIRSESPKSESGPRENVTDEPTRCVFSVLSALDLGITTEECERAGASTLTLNASARPYFPRLPFRSADQDSLPVTQQNGARNLH